MRKRRQALVKAYHHYAKYFKYYRVMSKRFNKYSKIYSRKA